MNCIIASSGQKGASLWTDLAPIWKPLIGVIVGALLSYLLAIRQYKRSLEHQARVRTLDFLCAHYLTDTIKKCQNQLKVNSALPDDKNNVSIAIERVGIACLTETIKLNFVLAMCGQRIIADWPALKDIGEKTLEAVANGQPPLFQRRHAIWLFLEAVCDAQDKRMELSEQAEKQQRAFDKWLGEYNLLCAKQLRKKLKRTLKKEGVAKK